MKMLRILTGGLVAGLLFVMLGFASSANATPVVFNLTSTNLSGVVGPVGTITITNVAGGAQISIAMDAGFSLKLMGGDIAFNLSDSATPGSISFDSITFGSTTITNPSISDGGVSSKNISEFGTFSFDITNLQCSNCGNGVVSADDLVFTVAGLSTSDFGTGSDFAVHFCTASGSKCGPETGFGASIPMTPTPEPSSLLLLGTGLMGLGAAMRRRLNLKA